MTKEELSEFDLKSANAKCVEMFLLHHFYQPQMDSYKNSFNIRWIRIEILSALASMKELLLLCLSFISNM